MSGKIRFRSSVCCMLLLLQAANSGGADDESLNPIGRPEKFRQGGGDGYALWYDDDEGIWCLRVTSKANTRTHFTGTVKVEGDKVIGEFQGFEKAKKAKDADWVFPHKDRKGFDFSFATFGKTDGVNFKAGKKAESIKFKLLVAGDDAPRRILIGAKGRHPEKATFTLPAVPVKK